MCVVTKEPNAAETVRERLAGIKEWEGMQVYEASVCNTGATITIHKE